MNRETIQGSWKQVKGKVKELWGLLTDDNFNVIAGRRDQHDGKMQRRFGMIREEADSALARLKRRASESPLAAKK